LGRSVIRVLVVVELRLYREGLAELLDSHEDIEVVGVAGGHHRALQETRHLQPDVVLVDMAMVDNIRVIRALARRSPAVRIIALGLPETEQSVIPCVEAGIAAYVGRDCRLADLVAAIRRIMQGEAECPPEIVASLFRRVAALAMQGRDPTLRAKLTGRELQIASLVMSGLSNKEIAGQLHIEVSTVKNHVHNVFEKLHVARRTQIASWLRAASDELEDLEPWQPEAPGSTRSI
jgi:two-component system, NarL family, nitrate/nitrite response regulator NarL